MQFITQIEKTISFFGKHRLDEKFGLGKEAEIFKVPTGSFLPGRIEVFFKDDAKASTHGKIYEYLSGLADAFEKGQPALFELGYCQIDNRVFKLESIELSAATVDGAGSVYASAVLRIDPVRKITKRLKRVWVWDLDEETIASYKTVCGDVEQAENFELQGEGRNTYEAITAAMLGYRVWRAKHPDQVVTYDPVKREFFVGVYDTFGRIGSVMSNTDKYLRKYKTDWVIEA